MTLKTTLISTALHTVGAVALGALAVLAFAPLGWWPLQVISLASLCYWLIQPVSPRRAFFIGIAFGYGWMASGIYSIFITFYVYCNLTELLAAAAALILNGYLALYAGLACGMARLLIQRWQPARSQRSMTVAAMLVIPACWTLSEWLRGWLLTGFPWLSSGYAHTASPFSGFAPVLGVYGIGYCVMLTASLIALAAYALAESGVAWRKKGRRCAGFLGLSGVMLAAGAALHQVNWTRPLGQPISVELLQGNIPQEIKFTPALAEPIIDWYSDALDTSRADLVVTPETAIPVYPQTLNKARLQRFAQQAAMRHQVLAIGLPTADVAPGQNDAREPLNPRNSVVVFSGAAKSGTGYHYIYSKSHLLPFGEYAPPGLRWFVDRLNIPLGDLSAGSSRQPPFAVRDQWILPNICYEDLFGEEIAFRLRRAASTHTPTASIMLNMSDIAWFGYTWVIPQHLQSSQMRSLETGRPTLRATNTGATAVIDQKGQVIGEIPFYTQGSLSASVQGYTGLTPYILTGNALIIWITILSLIAACILLRYGVGHSRLKKS